MGVETFILTQETYLHAALRALREEMAARLHARRERVREKAEQRIGEWLEWVEALEEADLANHRRAVEEPDWDFETADTENERQWRGAVALGREWLAVCDDWARAGLPVVAQTALRQKVEELEGILNWSDEYAASPAYRQLAEEAVAQYQAGQLEEGGWEIEESDRSARLAFGNNWQPCLPQSRNRPARHTNFSVKIHSILLFVAVSSRSPESGIPLTGSFASTGLIGPSASWTAIPTSGFSSATIGILTGCIVEERAGISTKIVD